MGKWKLEHINISLYFFDTSKSKIINKNFPRIVKTACVWRRESKIQINMATLEKQTVTITELYKIPESQ